MSSPLAARHSGCFWDENLLNVAILHLGLLSLSLHQTSFDNVFLFSLPLFFKDSRCYAKVDYCIKPHLADKEAQIRFPVMSHSVVSSKVKV